MTQQNKFRKSTSHTAIDTARQLENNHMSTKGNSTTKINYNPEHLEVSLVIEAVIIFTPVLEFKQLNF